MPQIFADDADLSSAFIREIRGLTSGSEFPAQGGADTEIVFVSSDGWFAVEILVEVKTPVQILCELYAQI